MGGSTVETLARKASDWGYDGLELACWGDHFEVDKALGDDGYLPAKRDLLVKHDLECWAISNHLVGQATCDPIDLLCTNRTNRNAVGEHRDAPLPAHGM